MKSEKYGMTPLGKVIWEEICRKAAAEGVVKIVEYVSANVVPIGEKTLRRRLSDDQWMVGELQALQTWCGSERIFKAVVSRFSLDGKAKAL